MEYDTITVHGRPLRRFTLIITDRFSLFANFDETATLPKTRFSGYAIGDSARQEQLTALRTVRFDSLAAPVHDPTQSRDTLARPASRWLLLATSDSVTVSLDTTWARPFRNSTILVRLRYDYFAPQDGRRATEFRLRERESLPSDFAFRRLETLEYSYCGPEGRRSFLLEATFLDASSREIARRGVDTRDPRGFPMISGPSVGASICDLRAQGGIRVGGA